MSAGDTPSASCAAACGRGGSVASWSPACLTVLCGGGSFEKSFELGWRCGGVGGGKGSLNIHGAE